MDERIKTTLLILVGIFVASYVAAAFFDTPDVTLENVALIKIVQPILSGSDGLFSEEFVSSDDLIEFIEQANTNDAIKAIVFEINSPGGSAVASAEVVEALQRVNKTTVAWIRETGASGAYWIASATDVIIAHPLSITGSIGVLGSYVDVAGLFDNYNITYNRLIAGRYKDMGTPFKALTADERMFLQKKLDMIHSYFITDVAKNRHLPRDHIHTLATGEFFLGTESKEQGLVDILGGKEEVISTIKQRINVTEVHFLEYEEEETFFDVLSELISTQSFRVGQGMGAAFTKQQFHIQT